jgi:hypothetical protein
MLDSHHPSVMNRQKTRFSIRVVGDGENVCMGKGPALTLVPPQALSEMAEPDIQTIWRVPRRGLDLQLTDAHALYQFICTDEDTN